MLINVCFCDLYHNNCYGSFMVFATLNFEEKQFNFVVSAIS